ncbi:succinate dehydrogenase cytochrome b subunit, partial [uncultured Muribaculum sp.]
LAASAGLALLFIIHIIYAVWLTLQNRKARGNDRYAVTAKPKSVEWSSQNMLVLGIVVLAFLVVHLIQFWAKMQLQEIRGVEGTLPPSMGTLFIQEAFSMVYTPIVYIIGFIALWFHMNHGFWSMFQSCGWDNDTWLPRLKKISCWWTTIVIALFIAQAVVFTVNAHNDFYKTDDALRSQYVGVIGKMVGLPVDRVSTEQLPMVIEQNLNVLSDPQFAAQLSDPQVQMQTGLTPEGHQELLSKYQHAKAFLDYFMIDNEAAPAAQPIEEQPEN